ncbi:MAG: LysR family transcriptional regulator [Hyphomicrobiaceae bacterium]|nr:LysR family transcriptional regulator [Hyphomicrobiaceae bacterium]
MLNLTFRQLNSLRAVMAHGKIANAARELGLTAPAVTIQMKQLEAELGLPLFDRTPQGVRPTAAGEAVARHAEALAAELQRLETELDAIKGLQSGSVRLGLVSTAKYFTPTMVAAFRKEHPGVEVTLIIGNRETIRAALHGQTIELALTGRPPRDLPLSAALIGAHPLVIAAAPDHPLAKARDISKERIAQERFLVREQGSGTRAALAQFLSDIAGRPRNLGTEMGSNETIKQAVMAGLGIAFISAHTIASEVENGRLVLLDVVGLPVLRQWFVVSRTDRALSPAAAAFQSFLIREGARFLPQVRGVSV